MYYGIDQMMANFRKDIKIKKRSRNKETHLIPIPRKDRKPKQKV